MQALVTGGAGFVGSHLVDRLLQNGYRVTVYDNRSTGQLNFLQHAQRYPTFELVVGDMFNQHDLEQALDGKDIVFHLAANADISHGLDDPGRDFTQNMLATQHLLEGMRHKKVKRIVLTSTGAVYGNPATLPIAEDCPFPTQTSMYGASKLAAEGLISAYCEGFGFQGLILRFVPMIGERYSHGHIFDFYKKLLNDPEKIEILGDGRQRKYGLYISDSIDAIMIALAVSEHSKLEIFNIGNDKYYTINECVSIVADYLSVKPTRFYTGERWAGDNPDMWLDSSRLRLYGWEPVIELPFAITRTVAYLQKSDWLVNSRV